MSGFSIHQTLVPREPEGLFLVVPAPAFAFFGVFGALTAAAMEVDRLWAKQGRREAQQLREGYTGKLSDAQASVMRDKECILAEIAGSGVQAEVEHAVQVLISAGMSTPELRAAARSGANVQGAGKWKVGMIVITVFMFMVHPALHAWSGISCGGALRFVPWLKVAEGALWLVILAFLRQDQWGLATQSAGRLAVLPYLFVWSLSAALNLFGAFGPCCSPRRVHCVPDAIGAFLLGPLMLCISAAGVARVARVPVLGPRLVGLLLGGSQETTPAADKGTSSNVVQDAAAQGL